MVPISSWLDAYGIHAMSPPSLPLYMHLTHATYVHVHIGDKYNYDNNLFDTYMEEINS